MPSDGEAVAAPAAGDPTRACVLEGGGLAGAVVRDTDWSKTPLGDTACWTSAFKTLLRAVMHAPQAMFIYWGESLVVLYNDASLPIVAEKHPHAIGQTAKECFAEAWGIIGPQLEEVTERGRSSRHENLLVPVHRGGRLDDSWFTYSYSPLFGDAGEVAGVLCVVTETTAEVLARKELESAKKEAVLARQDLHRVFMQAPTSICILRGPEHRFELTNPGYLQLVGNRELVGRSVREALPELAGQGFYELLDNVYATGERVVGKEVPISLARRPGEPPEEVVVNFVYEPFRDVTGAIVGILVVASDVTELSRARESLQVDLTERQRLHAIAEESREKAESANRTKDEFLATASHELRTPLNAILGWAQMLLAGTLDPSGHVRGLVTIERNAKAQVQLIEDILDGSRIITGQLRLETRPLDMNVLVQSAVDAIRPAAAAKRIEISVELDPAAARVVGDPDRIQQVMWNLLNNAVKFTPKAGTVAVKLEREGTDIELAISDSGQGIASDFLPHVFERFRQAEGSSTRRHGGLGLGLALVRHLVEAHGGTVRAESDGEGRGARFVVRFPVQAVFAEAASEPKPRVAGERDDSPPPSLAGTTILVVDDQADARDLVATVLRASGAEVTAVGSVNAAIEHLATSSPTLLISDIGMPERDGYELIRHVRGRAGPALPAIALTAYARDEDRHRALASGFQSYASKPVNPAELVRIVAALIAAPPSPAGGQEPS